MQSLQYRQAGTMYIHIEQHSFQLIQRKPSIILSVQRLPLFQFLGQQDLLYKGKMVLATKKSECQISTHSLWSGKTIGLSAVDQLKIVLVPRFSYFHLQRMSSHIPKITTAKDYPFFILIRGARQVALKSGRYICEKVTLNHDKNGIGL